MFRSLLNYIFKPILERIDTMSAQTDAILAKITSNNDALKSIQVSVDALREGNATIAAEIAALKAQIAGADFTKLETAVAEQSAVVEGLKTAIPANTPIQPSNN